MEIGIFFSPWARTLINALAYKNWILHQRWSDIFSQTRFDSFRSQNYHSPDRSLLYVRTYAAQIAKYFWLNVHVAISVITKLQQSRANVHYVHHTLMSKKTCDNNNSFFVKTKIRLTTTPRLTTTSSKMTTISSKMTTIAIAVPGCLLAVILVVTLIYFVCYRRPKRYVGCPVSTYIVKCRQRAYTIFHFTYTVYTHSFTLYIYIYTICIHACFDVYASSVQICTWMDTWWPRI